jgi:hypothetical protein
MKNSLKDMGEGIGGACLMAAAIITPFLRFRRLTWGATKEEVSAVLPGDDLIPTLKWQYTNSITIHAAPEDVWPWLVQIGQGRGGFYSYQALENLVGCKIYNADKILSEFQQLKAGDTMYLAPQVPFPVVLVESGRTIVLYFDSRTGIPQKPGTRSMSPFASSWLFYLENTDDKTARLISRFRISYNPSMGNNIAYGYLTEAIATTMQKKMLQGIRQRAESTLHT